MESMILIFIIIVPILLIIFVGSCSENVFFYTRDDGYKMFTSYDNEYTKLEQYFQTNEIEHKSNGKIKEGNISLMKDKLRRLYCTNVVQCSMEKKISINKLCYEANQVLKRKLGKTVVWKILMLRGDMDWKMPYTLGDVIIVPNKMTLTVKILVHEAIHILQKNNMKKMFDRLNTDLGFVPKDHIHLLLQNEEIKKRWITNPDGVNGTYLFKTKNGYISTLLLSNKNTHSACFVDTDEEGNVLNENIKEIPKRKCATCVLLHQSYHPNEILAEVLSR
jgi:hypothetical protein